MAAPKTKTDETPSDEVQNPVLNGFSVAGQPIDVVVAKKPDGEVAPAPGSDRTPGEPTPSKGSSDVVTISVTPEEAAAMRVLLSQISISGGPAGIATLIEQQREAVARNAATADSNEAALEAHQNKLKEMGITLQSAATPEIAAREMRARDKLIAKTLGMDKAKVPGGLYAVAGGGFVNANGDRVNEDGSKIEG